MILILLKLRKILIDNKNIIIKFTIYINKITILVIKTLPIVLFTKFPIFSVVRAMGYLLRVLARQFGDYQLARTNDNP